MEGDAEVKHVTRVIFVCTANIARSPYAEQMARLLVPDSGLRFESAGLPGTIDRPMDALMLHQLQRRGGDGSAHSSRPLDSQLLGPHDLVLTMQFAQAVRARDHWPRAKGTILGLEQLAHAAADASGMSIQDLLASAASLANSTAWDIEDPYGRGPDAASQCAAQLDQLLLRILPVLTGIKPVPPALDQGAPVPAPVPQAPRRGWWQRLLG